MTLIQVRVNAVDAVQWGMVSKLVYTTMVSYIFHYNLVFEDSVIQTFMFSNYFTIFYFACHYCIRIVSRTHRCAIRAFVL